MKRDKIDNQLQADVLIEMMTNETYEALFPRFADDPNMAYYQREVTENCVKSKTIIVAYKMPELGFVAEMSKHLSDRVDSFINSNYDDIACIKELMSSDTDLVIKRIETLSFASMINQIDDIKDDNYIYKAALNIEGLGTSMGYYCYLSLLINSNLFISYNELFVNAWFNYFENLYSNIKKFQMLGDNWKSQFIGAPFSVD